MSDAPAIEPGVYARMPFEQYLRIPALSSSGINNLLVSPGTFWANSWLNPDRNDEDTTARRIGRAFHMARLEPDRFAATYRPELRKGDFEIATHEQIKAELAARGLPQTAKGERVLEAALRLREAGYGAPIWHLELDEWERDANGRDSLPADTFDEIVRDAERLRLDADIAGLLDDGWPEVSVVWRDDHGTLWKARFDFVSARALVDVKTFSNPYGKPLDRCIRDAIQFNRYYVQAALYFDVAERIRAGVIGAGEEASQPVVDALRGAMGPMEFWWIFQETGGIPNVLARQFRMTLDVHPHHLAQEPTPESAEEFARKLQTPSFLLRKARDQIAGAASLYRRAMEIWGTEEPWGTMMPVNDIGDEDFSPYFFEADA